MSSSSQQTQDKVSEMLTGVWRIKWWKYRYVLFAVLVANVLLINHFFVEKSISVADLNPFSPSYSQTDDNVSKSAPQKRPGKRPGSSPTVDVLSPPPQPPSMLSLNDYDFNGEYIGWPLQRQCDETKWQEGLVYVCDNNSGGIGNIRNFILTCIRYAIDAGATGITMPQIQRRSEEDLANIFTTGFQPFDYFFDEQHFRDALAQYCPQMKIYSTYADIPHQPRIRKIEEFYPKDLGDLDGCDGRGTNNHLDMFRLKFDQWLARTNRTPTEDAPTTIRLKWATFFEWPIYRDGPEFAATFGDLLRINPNISSIAVAVMKKLSEFGGVQPKADTFELPYLGVHLRTESDALGFWPNFDTQTKGYLQEAQARELKTAYLACGNATDGHRFADLAREQLGLNVTSKLDLLAAEGMEDTLKALTDLSWDQQALVDFLVLTKSSHFTGCSFSSFTMNIGFKRHLMTGGLLTRPWKSPGDEFTTLVGRFDNWYGDWMFMYECMWP